MPDLITMLGNLSRSLIAVEYLVTGISYIVGLTLIISSIFMLKKISNAAGHSQEDHFKVFAVLLMGSLLLFLPTSIRVLSDTVFGSENILSYSNYNQMNIFQSMGVLLKTVGLIWFVRGCMLVANASQPGEQHGIRGLFFIVSGILAMNFKLTMSAVLYIVNKLINLSITFKL